MTISEICSDLGKPETDIADSIAELGIAPDYLVGNVAQFMTVKVQRIKVAIISAANKKSLAAMGL